MARRKAPHANRLASLGFRGSRPRKSLSRRTQSRSVRMCYRQSNLPPSLNFPRGSLCASRRTVAHRGGGLSPIGATMPQFQTLTVSDSDKLRFWAKVIRFDGGACWGWRGSVGPNGYAHISIHQKNRLAHRVSYVIHNGELPSNRLVCHHCDNPTCTNPAHLFLGTYRDNTRDSQTKGRFHKARGQAHGRAQFTEAQIAQMRSDWVPLVFTLKMVAAKHGVSINTLKDIIYRKTWKHI